MSKAATPRASPVVNKFYKFLTDTNEGALQADGVQHLWVSNKQFDIGDKDTANHKVECRGVWVAIEELAHPLDQIGI